MKKKTISAILLAFNICMVIAIFILVIKINARGPKPEEQYADMGSGNMETSVSSTNANIEEEQKEESIFQLIVIPNTTTSVNVRSGPGTDYNRVGSAYADCEYKVIEIYNDEWTKIDYDGEFGYIYNEYIDYQYKAEFEDGTASYASVPEEDLKKYYKENASDVYINTDQIDDQLNKPENSEEEGDNSEENN